MPIHDIHHVAVRSLDVDASVRFYTEVLGMRVAPRPPLDVPGAWLQMGRTQLHIVGGEAAYDAEGKYVPGCAAVDHIAIFATGYDDFRQQVVARGLDYRQADLRDAGLWQLFVKDPSGVTIELNFVVKEEPAGSAGPTAEKPHRIGKF